MLYTIVYKGFAWPVQHEVCRNAESVVCVYAMPYIYSDSFCHLFLTGHELVAMHEAAGFEAAYIPSCDEKATTTDPRVAKRISTIFFFFCSLISCCLLAFMLVVPSVVIYCCWTGLNLSPYQANATIVAKLQLR